jgi:hypothetical protein
MDLDDLREAAKMERPQMVDVPEEALVPYSDEPGPDEGALSFDGIGDEEIEIMVRPQPASRIVRAHLRAFEEKHRPADGLSHALQQ